jgi:ferredoxin--NADP+ reductase
LQCVGVVTQPRFVQGHGHETVKPEPATGLRDGSIPAKAGLAPLDPALDRVMICGSEAMLKDTVTLMKDLGFEEGSSSRAGHYVIEKAFVEK